MLHVADMEQEAEYLVEFLLLLLLWNGTRADPHREAQGYLTLQVF